MGLSSVQVVIDLEAALGIKIPDEDAAKLRTVGELQDYLIGRMPDMPVVKCANRCYTSHLFYRLRQGICAATGLAKAQIRPSTTLEEIRRESGCKHIRRPLTQIADVTLPSPGWSHASTFVMSTSIIAVTSLSVALVIVFDLRPPALMFLLLLPLILGMTLGYYLGDRIRPDFEAQIVTVADLTRTLVNRNVLEAREKHGEFTESDVWDILKETVATWALIPADDITRESDLVEILGD